MDETRLVTLVRIVDSVTPEAEELLTGTVGTTCQKNAGNRQSHLLAETKCVGGFHVGNGDGKAQRGWKVLRAEVGVEVERNLADHADDVAAVGGILWMRSRWVLWRTRLRVISRTSVMSLFYGRDGEAGKPPCRDCGRWG